MKNRKPLMIITVALVLVLMMAGCARTHSSDSKNRDEEEPEETTVCTTAAYGADEGLTEDIATEEITADDSLSAAGNGNVSMNSADGTAVSYEPADSGEPDLDPEQGRLLVRTVSMNVETKDFPGLCNTVISQADALGGYIENSSVTGTGMDDDLRSATYVLRIPADSLDSLIAQVGTGSVVISSNENTSDVTLTYSDTKARIDALKQERDQLMDLMAQANDLDTLLTLQNELTNVRYEIDSAESQLRIMANQVNYATLNLTVDEVLVEEEPEEAHVVSYREKIADTFKESVRNIKEGFMDFFLGLVAVSPVLVPVIVILAAAAIVIIARIKAVKRAKKTADKDGNGAGTDAVPDDKADRS